MNSRLLDDKYLVRRKVFTLSAGKFHIYNGEGELVLFCKQKAFKLKEDIRLYSDESMTEEVISIQARSSIDFSASYDVVDAESGQKIGALRRKGMKSILKDEWVVLDENDNELGLIKEDSRGMALIRRFLLNIIPQNFDLLIDGKKVVDLKQRFNPFIYKLDIDFSFDSNNQIDKKLGISAAILISAIEGRQN